MSLGGFQRHNASVFFNATTFVRDLSMSKTAHASARRSLAAASLVLAAASVATRAFAAALATPRYATRLASPRHVGAFDAAQLACSRAAGPT